MFGKAKYLVNYAVFFSKSQISLLILFTVYIFARITNTRVSLICVYVLVSFYAGIGTALRL